MRSKQKPTSDAVEIMHRRYIKGNKRRLKYIEEEGKRLEIAQRIFELRNEANLTQKELAKLVGTRQSVISRLEGADYEGYTFKMLDKIAQAVHCRVEIDFVRENGHFAYAQ
jgi:DNA-binding XRE family transcriptional regulator